MKFTLRQVEIFLQVASEMHFARAAQALHISQPTVSQEIRRLEKALGVQLFDRTTRGVRLTASGASVIEESKELVALADRLQEKAFLLAPQNTMNLRLVVSPSIVNRLLPAVMSQCEKDLPELKIEDIPVDTGDVTTRLQSERADVGLGRFLSAPFGFRSEVLGHETVVAALSAHHPLAGNLELDLAELGDLPLLLWPRERNPAYYDALLDICSRHGLSPLILVSSPMIAGARSYLITEGRAFSLIPISAARQLSTNLRAIPLKNSSSLPLEMLWREGDPRKVLPQFLDVIRAQAAALIAADGHVEGTG